MIDLHEACKIVTAYHHEPFVEGITDIGIGYVISIVSSEGYVADEAPTLVHKDKGDAEPYFIPDHFEEIKKGKRIEVPEEYRYKG